MTRRDAGTTSQPAKLCQTLIRVSGLGPCDDRDLFPPPPSLFLSSPSSPSTRFLLSIASPSLPAIAIVSTSTPTRRWQPSVQSLVASSSRRQLQRSSGGDPNDEQLFRRSLDSLLLPRHTLQTAKGGRSRALPKFGRRSACIRGLEADFLCFSSLIDLFARLERSTAQPSNRSKMAPSACLLTLALALPHLISASPFPIRPLHLDQIHFAPLPSPASTHQLAPSSTPSPRPVPYCQVGQTCFPDEKEVEKVNKTLEGSLRRVLPAAAVCYAGPQYDKCALLRFQITKSRG